MAKKVALDTVSKSGTVNPIREASTLTAEKIGVELPPEYRTRTEVEVFVDGAAFSRHVVEPENPRIAEPLHAAPMVFEWSWPRSLFDGRDHHIEFYAAADGTLVWGGRYNLGSWFRHSVDYAGPNRAYGWIWAPDGKACAVEVLIDREVHAEIRARIYRKDLEEGGLGDGRYGFDFEWPKSILDGELHEVAFRRAGDELPFWSQPPMVYGSIAQQAKKWPEDRLQLAPSAVQGSDHKLWNARLDRFVVQPIITSGRASKLELGFFYRTLRGNVSQCADGLFLSEDAIISFNTYHNSFYATYWQKFSALRNVSISGIITGSARIIVYQSIASLGIVRNAGSFLVTGENEPFHIDLDITDVVPREGIPGRYFFDIISETETLISDLSYSTRTPPLRDTSVSLGICTYRKEEYLRNICGELASSRTKTQGFLDKVILVNNDKAPGFDDWMLNEIVETNPDLFSVFGQSNIGGAGGFTRSLYESLSISSSSYHLMMDDDVYFDSIMIVRLVSFLDYSRYRIVVGGQMTNMEQPGQIYESGATVESDGILQKVGGPLDGTNVSQITFFDAFRPVDYNAWWFCAIPKDIVAEAGLPMNIFIRGDDFEYAIRMARYGVPTISWPGLFVWHEPFEGKVSRWLEYYNLRNRLIVTAVHRKANKFKSQKGEHIWEQFDNALAVDDTEMALAVALALRDFARGPDNLFKLPVDQVHQSLLAALKQSAKGSPKDRRLPVRNALAEASEALGGKKSTNVSTLSLESLGAHVLELYDGQNGTLAELWIDAYKEYTTRDYWKSVFG